LIWQLVFVLSILQTKTTEAKMAVKGSKNTKQRATKTKAEMMGKDSEGKDSNQNAESEASENSPKMSKQESTERDGDKPVH
jgi:hypothetical protein